MFIHHPNTGRRLNTAIFNQISRTKQRQLKFAPAAAIFVYEIYMFARVYKESLY